MAINDVSLTAGMRSNLLSLQQTVTLMNRTQERLATGKKVNSALDNPINYFTAKSHTSRANDLASLKDGMGEAVQNIKAADKGISSINTLVEQAKALGQAAKGATKNQVKVQVNAVAVADVITVGGLAYTAVASAGAVSTSTQFVVADEVSATISNLAALINKNAETSDMSAIASGTTLILQSKGSTEAITQGNYGSYVVTTGMAGAVVLTDVDGYNVFSERRALGDQYTQLMTQIDQIAGQSGYKGTNLLMNEDLNVAFEGSSLSVKGFSATASDLGLNTVASTTTSGDNWGWSVNTEINADLGKLDVAIATLRSEATKLSNNLSIITVQNDFSSNMINTLTEGADKLTLADMNEEGANMLMLQTRQSLGTTALSLSAQAAQSVLRLF